MTSPSSPTRRNLQGNRTNNRVAYFFIILFVVRFFVHKPIHKEDAFVQPIWGAAPTRGRIAAVRTSGEVYNLLSWDDATTNNNARNHGYPQWQDEGGIQLEPLLEFMQGALQNTDAIFRHSKLFPETPYIVNDKGVWTSQAVMDRVDDVQRVERWNPSHQLAMLAWTVLQRQGAERWPVLYKAVQSGGFPYVAWYGDNRKCNHKNWKNHSLPVFTTCARVGCHSTFPLPTYKTIRDSKVHSDEWKHDAQVRKAKYPWHDKIRKIVWRGSLWLDGYYTSTVASPRWKMCKIAKEHPHPAYDFGLVQVAEKQVNLADVGGLVDPIPMEDFQKYIAILDVDGTSWSSRFGSLLCYNSVVVKVEPEYVDYFHYDLVPWTHYIPVKRDLSNLREVADFISDSHNDAQLLDIVHNANAWCHSRMTASMLAEDVLHIWDAYVDALYQHNPQWMDVWNTAKSSLSPLDLRLEK